MAGLAIKFLMGAIELVIGLGVVIEFPYAPAVGIVAGDAMVAERAFVGIVLFVTGAAI